MAVDPSVGADVEIYEPVYGREPSVVCPKRVRVNGADVGILAKDGLTVDHGGPGRPMSVTLVLYPRTIWMGAEVQYAEDAD